ncbi:MAG: hypothetical protein ACI837_001176 [Crocinitomicaceae bacterium]|jgi:hypothetical protein
MKLKDFFLKNWQHFFVIAVILITAAVFYQPQLNGSYLDQGDINLWKGAAQEIRMSREINDVEPLWTNALFGGMPAVQISVIYSGNLFKEVINFYTQCFPNPIGQLILHLIGFYIFALFLRIKPIIGLLGAMAFSFASYELIIVEAGHNTKAMASVFLAPTLGAFIYAYRDRRLWGILFASIFMTLELTANHLQVTYYFIFMLVIVGIYFFFEFYKKKKLKSFLLTSGGLIAAFVIAGLINYGNISMTADYASSSARGVNDLTLKADGTPIKTTRAGLDKTKILKWSYGIGETFTFISPNVKGGGSFLIGGSQFEDIVDNSDFTSSEQKDLKTLPAYWGEQPGTNGPIYLGAVTLLLAFLGMIFIKDRLKWALLAVIVLVTALAWGSNFMGLSDLFIDHVPGYNRFRSITMILILAEIAVATLAMIFLSEIIKEREKFREKKMVLLITVGAMTVFFIAVNLIGLGDGYMSSVDQGQIDNVEVSIRQQVMETDPAIMLSQQGVNMNDPAAVNQFIDRQVEPYDKRFANWRSIRESIYHSSMNRTIIFILLAGGLLIAYVFTSMSVWMLTFGMLGLTMIDQIPIADQYIGDEDRFWTDSITANRLTTADDQVLQFEIAQNPKLKAITDKAFDKGKKEADLLELEGGERTAKMEEYRFFALNMNTNYRVFDYEGGYGSCRASYWHKSIGGFHAAQMRSAENMINFHLGTMNEKVYDMYNVKYFLQASEKGYNAIPRTTALGNAWLIQEIEVHPTADSEIRGLGNSYEIVNRGEGVFLLNDIPTDKAIIYGGEKLGYLMPQLDTLQIPVRAGLRVGEEAAFVMDAYGNSNLVPMSTLAADTLKSFRQLVTYKVLTSFEPQLEAVMLESEAKKLSAKKFTGEGTIKMDSYAPNKLTYSADVKSKQFAVFSEVYINEGWKATVDGKEVDILKTNYSLRGIEVPKGKHKIEFVYDLPKYHTSNMISLILSILLILGMITLAYLDIKKKREKNVEVSE